MLLPPPDRRNSFAQRLFTPLPARYDRLAELLSFGQNGRWRHAMVGHRDSIKLLRSKLGRYRRLSQLHNQRAAVTVPPAGTISRAE